MSRYRVAVDSYLGLGGGAGAPAGMGRRRCRRGDVRRCGTSLAPEVVSLARRISPAALCSLDAIHLVSALLVDADLVMTYDVRLAVACGENGPAVAKPGVDAWHEACPRRRRYEERPTMAPGGGNRGPRLHAHRTRTTRR